MAKRELTDVLDDMLDNAIPMGEVDLREKLQSIRGSAHYTAPEAMATQWRRVLHVLDEQIGEPDEPWQDKVAAIFSGRQP